ncbi:hypothetical protein [Alistipes sp.]|uniref:hypothetical protein n=1 Tax=Alistipes sp. TaxID=1872444 RepID=UPI00261414ED|nr:hypothetical protein [Alistipes sp.]HUN14366.1 hypothetical protein [Alistipes sp.]
MKKLILSAIVLLSVSSCDLLKIFQMDPFEPEHTTEWYIKNLSDETIVITTRNLYGARTVEVGDSVCIIAFHPWQSKGIPTFDPFFKCWQTDYWGDEQYLTIFSADGEVLKRWKYTPESAADDPFFQESSWRFYQKEYETNSELELTWVYDLRPEDLVSDETVY